MTSWFGLMKIMARPEVEVDLEPEDLDIDMGDDGGDDNDCQCQWEESCMNKATLKNPEMNMQICGFHLNDFLELSGGNHGFRKWDCERGEYLE